MGEIKNKKNTNTKNNLLETVIEAIKEKKGENIVTIDLRNITSRVSDYFVICEAFSNVHIQSIAKGVEEIVKQKTSEKPLSKEGIKNSQWVLIDYANVVVHIFESECRKYYNLENLWADDKIVNK